MSNRLSAGPRFGAPHPANRGINNQRSRVDGPKVGEMKRRPQWKSAAFIAILRIEFG